MPASSPSWASTAVVPVASVASVHPHRHQQPHSHVGPVLTALSDRMEWVYSVQPSRELPIVDLSITLQSRWLSGSASSTSAPDANRRPLKQRTLCSPLTFFSGYLFTCLLYVVVVVVPVRVGQVLGIIGLITGLPGTLRVVGALRYDIVKVLASTFDILFFGTLNSVAPVVLMVMLADTRMLVFFVALVANQVNIFLDANIQNVRRLTVINSFVVMCLVSVGCLTTLELVPEMADFAVFQYGTHRLEARMVAANGIVTILALLLRNVYRKRATLFKTSTAGVVDCVSYRCSLAFQQMDPGQQQNPLGPSAAASSMDSQLAPAVQQLHHMQCIPPITARRVVDPRVFFWVVVESTKLKRFILGAMGWTAALVLLAAAVTRLIHLVRTASSTPLEPTATTTPVATGNYDLFVALACTCVYAGICLALCQRQLLVEIGSSFDFLFLSSQLTFVHIAVADFFGWRRSCWLVLGLSWVWSHWVFCTDALTPVVRQRIGFTHAKRKLIVLALVLSTGVLTHLLIFNASSVNIYDRVVWEGRMFGHDVEFRLLSTFYSCYITVVAWSMRLLWRVLCAKPNELIAIDGPVAYDNYLRRRPR